ncbi:hypothetical protein ACFL0F_02420 [Patescibacteria group bacterium]
MYIARRSLVVTLIVLSIVLIVYSQGFAVGDVLPSTPDQDETGDILEYMIEGDVIYYTALTEENALRQLRLDYIHCDTDYTIRAIVHKWDYEWPWGYDWILVEDYFLDHADFVVEKQLYLELKYNNYCILRARSTMGNKRITGPAFTYIPYVQK